MFTNKNKLIGFIALIVVVVLVASAAVALIADGSNKKALEAANAQLQEKLDQVQAELDAAKEELENTETDLESALATIKTLSDDLKAAKADLASVKSDLATTQGELDDAEARVKDLEDKIVELISNWAAATPEVHSAVVAITTAYDKALESEYLYADSTALEGLYDAKMNAIYAVIRSTSTEDIQAVVDGFTAEIAEIEKDRYDNTLRDMIEAVKVDGVTHPEDVEGVVECEEYVKNLVDNTEVYNKLVELGLVAEVEELRKLLDADEEKDLGDAFVAAADLIPTYVQLSDAETVKAAREAYEELNGKYPVVSGEREDVDAALKKLVEAEQRLEALVDIVAEAEAINALIKSTTATVAADPTTRDAIDAIATRIEAWEELVAEEDPNWNLIDRDGYAALVEAYNNAVAELKALYDAFKTAVEAIGDVTPDSADAIDAAWGANTALTANVYFKEILGAEVAAEYDELLAKLQLATDTLTRINDLIDRIRKAIDALYTADPITVKSTDLDALESMILELTVDLGQKLEVIDTADVDYCARLAYVRLIPHKNEAIVAVETAYTKYQALVGAEHGGQYDLYYKLSLVNSQLHEEIINATSREEIKNIVDGIDADFAACLTVEK